jgi:hypothetical protein
MANMTTAVFCFLNIQNKRLFEIRCCSLNNQTRFGLHGAIFDGEFYSDGLKDITVKTVLRPKHV